MIDVWLHPWQMPHGEGPCCWDAAWVGDSSVQPSGQANRSTVTITRNRQARSAVSADRTGSV